MKSKLTDRILLLAVTVFLVAGPGAWAAESGYKGLLVEPPKTLHVHAMTNHTGKSIRFPEANGKLKLAFFGYTSCPDVCPMTLGKMKQLITKLGPVAEDMEFYFISIDPQRDNALQLNNFVSYYDRHIIGITGSLQELKAVESDFGILTRKFQGKSSFAYTLEHSSFIYLLDKNGRLRIMYPATTPTDSIISDIELLK